MSTINLRQFFAPRSICVIGASDRTGSVGNVVLKNLIASGFELHTNQAMLSLAGELGFELDYSCDDNVVIAIMPLCE